MSIKFLTSLCLELSRYKYTYLDLNDNEVPKKYVSSLKNYRTIPLDIIESKKIGLCWDITNYTYRCLSSKGYNIENYFIQEYESKRKDWCHTFNVIYTEGVVVWFEPVYRPMQGIHCYASLHDLMEDVVVKTVKDTGNNWDIYKYRSDGLDQKVEYDDFIERVKNQGMCYMEGVPDND